jgi:hypothetical protein
MKDHLGRLYIVGVEGIVTVYLNGSARRIQLLVPIQGEIPSLAVIPAARRKIRKSDDRSFVDLLVKAFKILVALSFGIDKGYRILGRLLINRIEGDIFCDFAGRKVMNACKRVNLHRKRSK